MASLFEFLAAAIGGAAICTTVIAVIARPISTSIQRIIYPTTETTRGITAPASR